MSLPEATEEPHFEYLSFRVRGRIFATAPPDGASLNIFVEEDERAPLIDAEPDTYEALHWGSKVVGVKVQLERANAGMVKGLLLWSWTRKAPRRLAASFEQTP